MPYAEIINADIGDRYIILNSLKKTIFIDFESMKKSQFKRLKNAVENNRTNVNGCFQYAFSLELDFLKRFTTDIAKSIGCQLLSIDDENFLDNLTKTSLEKSIWIDQKLNSNKGSVVFKFALIETRPEPIVRIYIVSNVNLTKFIDDSISNF